MKNLAPKTRKQDNMDTSQNRSMSSNNEVFIVHGRDDTYKHIAARVLEKLGLQPIILHEQHNAGRTIIEKFEDHSSSTYAIIILTPDDKGGLANDKQLLPRARQNVIFELGYFIGKLTRNRVCALYKEGVELPSDLGGVLFIPLDDGGAWKFKLAQELKATGLDIDLNKVVQI